ncbi:hypothetical protein D0Z08_23140 [Nocardioides immobilis]|uniref:Uncharacterized protein n=1 Tax=Nocardioides immobilis TaxID=2049295 RepID=A0A417XWE8_9ACTN|nr:hypothetical protein [Nocardioides immobilis]RHW24635.1 hypothetical protein D0Z08_23140 [Nocardioides immobilis]
MNTVIREWAVIVATTSLLLVGCSEEPDDRASDDPASTTATSETPDDRASTTTATSEAPAASPLEGTWKTRPISLKETEATIRRQLRPVDQVDRGISARCT